MHYRTLFLICKPRPHRRPDPEWRRRSSLRTLAWRSVPALVVAPLAFLGLRTVTTPSTFQPFGDFVARVETTEKFVALIS